MSQLDVSSLVGIPWKHETADCYTLMCQFYEKFFNLTLTNYARPPMWFEKDPSLDLIRNNFRAEGFVPFIGHRKDYQVGDAFLIALGSSTINHCAAYLGNGMMLHSPFRRKSEVVIYAGHYLDKTLIVARHPSIIPEKNRTSIDVFDMLSASKKAQFQDVYNRNVRAGGFRP